MNDPTGSFGSAFIRWVVCVQTITLGEGSLFYGLVSHRTQEAEVGAGNAHVQTADCSNPSPVPSYASCKP